MQDPLVPGPSSRSATYIFGTISSVGNALILSRTTELMNVVAVVTIGVVGFELGMCVRYSN
jgi:hypothetical protein